MKRLISILLVIATFVIGCMPTAMATFVMGEMDMSSNMAHVQVMSSDCCDTMSGDCAEKTHECCLSPFKDSIISSVSVPQNEDKKIKGKTLSIDILALFQESQSYNYNEKLTSPPDGIDLSGESDGYTTLTGIIKSNC